MGSLTVHVLGGNQNPISGKEVYCNFVNSFTHSTEYTDRDGSAEFDDIPTGGVEISINGAVQMTIEVGQNDDEDVTITI